MKDRIYKYIPDANLGQIYFSEENEHGFEGTYIYVSEGKYKTASVEKGIIKTKEEYENFDDVLWFVLNVVVFSVALEYASKNREKGKDFRRVLFKKEVELCSMFGAHFEKRINDEIREILEKHPYVDG